MEQNFLTILKNKNIERQKVWDSENQLTLLFKVNEFFGEAGELANEIKKLERERLGLVGSRTTQEKIENEIADVLITLDLIATKLNIDLTQATKNKFNQTSVKNNFDIFID